MHRNVFAAAVCLIVALTARAESGVVDALEINGLSRTEPFVVTRELPWKEGTPFTDEQWELGLVRLWNMNLFSQVAARIDERDGRRVAVFDLEERFTLNPLLRFSTAGSAYWYRLGATDTNLFGRFIEAGAQYERFVDYHGGQAWVRDPRLFNRRLNGLVLGERLARPRPGFVVFRALARLEVAGFTDSQDRVLVLGRIDALADRFDRIDDATTPLPAPSEGAIVTAGVRYGRIDIARNRQRGWTAEIRPSLGVVTGASPFAQLFGELLAFAMPGTRWTFAARLQGAVSTSAPEQHQLYVGGLDLVRGLPDNAIRTPAYLVGNVEARFVAFDSTWVAFVPTVFVDTVIARTEAGGVRGEATAGGGLRMLSPKLVTSGLRGDIAVRLGTGEVQPSFGVYQFF